MEQKEIKRGLADAKRKLDCGFYVTDCVAKKKRTLNILNVCSFKYSNLQVYMLEPINLIES